MKEVVILGTGYAGLKTVVLLQRKLKNNVHTTLVDRNNYRYEATDLHEATAGTQSVPRVTYPVSDVINPQITTSIQNEVIKTDPDKKAVKLVDHEELLHYDYYILGLGFVSETFGIPDVEESALPMTNVKEALAIYDRIVAKMEDYRTTHSSDDFQIVIRGGGFTGIELAEAPVDARTSYARITGVSPDEIKITLVEASTRSLPILSEKLAEHEVNLIKSLNMQLLDGSRISKIGPGKVTYEHGDDDEESLSTGTITWITGVSGDPSMEGCSFGARRSRVIVVDYLTDPRHDDICIIRDVAAIMSPNGKRPHPTTARIVLAVVNYTAEDIVSRIKAGKYEAKPFACKLLGTAASINNTWAFGETMGHELRGYPALAMEKTIADYSLLETGGLEGLFAKGRFDLYHQKMNEAEKKLSFFQQSRLYGYLSTGMVD